MWFFNIANTQDLMVMIYLPSYLYIYYVYIWTLIGHYRIPLWSIRSRKCWGTIYQIHYQNLYSNCTLSRINSSKNSQGSSESFLERSSSDTVKRILVQPVKILPSLSHSYSFFTYNPSLIKVKCSRKALSFLMLMLTQPTWRELEFVQLW